MNEIDNARTVRETTLCMIVKLVVRCLRFSSRHEVVVATSLDCSIASLKARASAEEDDHPKFCALVAQI